MSRKKHRDQQLRQELDIAVGNALALLMFLWDKDNNYLRAPAAVDRLNVEFCGQVAQAYGLLGGALNTIKELGVKVDTPVESCSATVDQLSDELTKTKQERDGLIKKLDEMSAAYANVNCQLHAVRTALGEKLANPTPLPSPLPPPAPAAQRKKKEKKKKVKRSTSLPVKRGQQEMSALIKEILADKSFTFIENSVSKDRFSERSSYALLDLVTRVDAFYKANRPTPTTSETNAALNIIRCMNDQQLGRLLYLVSMYRVAKRHFWTVWFGDYADDIIDDNVELTEANLRIIKEFDYAGIEFRSGSFSRPQQYMENMRDRWGDTKRVYNSLYSIMQKYINHRSPGGKEQ